MNMYLKKRQKAGMKKSEVAHSLGISYGRYQAIERGIVKMPQDLIDKFNEITSKSSTEVMFDRMSKSVAVDEWYNEMLENNKEKLKNKMKEFNIQSYKHLSELLGYKASSIITVRLNHPNEAPFDFKNKLYGFFQNELNIQIAGRKNIETTVVKKENDLDKFFDNFDLINYVSKCGLPQIVLEREMGLSTSTLNHYLRGRTKRPSLHTIKKIKDYVEQHPLNSEQIQMDIPAFPEIPDEVVNDYCQVVKENEPAESDVKVRIADTSSPIKVLSSDDNSSAKLLRPNHDISKEIESEIDNLQHEFYRVHEMELELVERLRDSETRKITLISKIEALQNIKDKL